MRKQWKMLWCLSGLVSLCWVGGGTAMGQETIRFPQYPQYVQYPQDAPPVIPAAKLRPVFPSTTTVPRVIYSQP